MSEGDDPGINTCIKDIIMESTSILFLFTYRLSISTEFQSLVESK